MELKARFARVTVSALATLVMCGCSTMEYRSAPVAIEVIESNYIESTNDAEIVTREVSQPYAAAKTGLRS
jgi:hypothetical protein